MLRAIASITRSLKRFGRARDGATAVEFAFIAGPFFLMVIGMAEVSMIGLAQTNLDYAVSEVGRIVRTGEAQDQEVDYDQMKEILCDSTNAILPVDCDANLFLDVASYDSFDEVTNDDPIVDGVFNPAGFNYAPGGASAIVVVRAYYRWRIITPFFQGVFSNVGSGDRILASTLVFRSEPFPEDLAP